VLTDGRSGLCRQARYVDGIAPAELSDALQRSGTWAKAAQMPVIEGGVWQAVSCDRVGWGSSDPKQ